MMQLFGFILFSLKWGKPTLLLTVGSIVLLSCSLFSGVCPPVSSSSVKMFFVAATSDDFVKQQEPPYKWCTQGLRIVYNKAVQVSLHRNMVDNLLKTLGTYNQHYFPLLYCPAIPHPHGIKNELIEDDALDEIIKNKKVRVGTVKANWGFAGDYSVHPPTGFFPSLTTEIVTRMGEIVNEPLDVEWVQMPMNDILPSLDNYTIHMTDTYFLYPTVVSEAEGFNSPRMNYYFGGCPVCSSNSFMVVKSNSTIMSLRDLQNFTLSAINDRDKRVLFMSRANYNAIIHLLPRQIIADFKRTPGLARIEVFSDIQAGKAVAGIFSSPTASQILKKYDLKQVSLDVNIAHGPWFKKTWSYECVEKEMKLKSLDSADYRIKADPSFMLMLSLGSLSLSFLPWSNV